MNPEFKDNVPYYRKVLQCFERITDDPVERLDLMVIADAVSRGLWFDDRVSTAFQFTLFGHFMKHFTDYYLQKDQFPYSVSHKNVK